jgi:hypothetical protein
MYCVQHAAAQCFFVFCFLFFSQFCNACIWPNFGNFRNMRVENLKHPFILYCRQLRGLFWTIVFWGVKKPGNLWQNILFPKYSSPNGQNSSLKKSRFLLLLLPLSLFDMLLVRGFRNLMFPLRFALLGHSFVFLDVGPSILFLVFSLFWLLWFIYDWQGFIILKTNLHMEHTPIWSNYFAKPVIGFLWYSWWTLGGQFELPFS